MALPAFDRNGRSAGIWLNPLTTDDGNGLRGFSGEGRPGMEFVALQGSRNGKACWLIICRMVSGLPVITPDSGVVVRIAGEGRPWNPGAITGGRVWGISRTTASSREPEMVNRSRQRYWHSGRLKRPSAVKRNAAQMKLSGKWQRTNLTCRTAKQSWLSGDIAGQERDRTATSERENRCRRVCCVNHNGNGKRSGRLPGKSAAEASAADGAGYGS